MITTSLKGVAQLDPTVETFFRHNYHFKVLKFVFRLKRTAPTAYCDCWEKCKCRALVPGSQAARIQLLKKLVSETDLVTRPNGR